MDLKAAATKTGVFVAGYTCCRLGEELLRMTYRGYLAGRREKNQEVEKQETQQQKTSNQNSKKGNSNQSAAS